MPKWWDKWVNPTTVIALIGGIIWGIQLNQAVVYHAKQIGELTGENKEHRAHILDMHSVSVRMVAAMEDLARRTVAIEEDVEKNHRDLANWQQKIIRLEEALRRIEQRNYSTTDEEEDAGTFVPGSGYRFPTHPVADEIQI